MFLERGTLYIWVRIVYADGLMFNIRTPAVVNGLVHQWYSVLLSHLWYNKTTPNDLAKLWCQRTVSYLFPWLFAYSGSNKYAGFICLVPDHGLIHCGLVTPLGSSIWVNIGSGNGLGPLGTNPLPEPLLTYRQIILWYLPGNTVTRFALI